MLLDDTIAAISTPIGEGALAVIRISGPDALRIANTIFKPAGHKESLPPRTLVYGRMVEEDGKVLDRGLLAIFPAPASYTGENMAELHCHGGILVSAQILQEILRLGARAAAPGEFTRRAFLNGKMDLTQAEAVMDVIRARTPASLKAAEEQLSGRLGREIEAIRVQLLQTVAHLEAYIDFPEEDIDPHTDQKLRNDIQSGIERIDALLSTALEGRILREGVQLVLCGVPNAGKSSLLNQLLGFDRAIVSPIPGTTRDTIEESASLHGIPFRITDTAGIRDSADTIEQEGILRAHKAIQAADVVVQVIDATEPHLALERDDVIIALNKTDLAPSPSLPATFQAKTIPISCTTGDGIPQLVDAIVGKVQLGLQAGGGTSLAAINARHQACLQKARARLEEALSEMDGGSAPEFISPPVRMALDSIGEVTGATGIEDILGMIFSTFCIGK